MLKRAALLSICGLMAFMPERSPAREVFAVRTVNAPGETAARYLACLERHERRRWLREQQSGGLIDARVFEKTGERNDLDGPAWSVLTVLRARDQAAAERLNKPLRCQRLPNVQVIRSELMSATPGSDHRPPKGRLRRSDLAFLIEFIPVHETPQALAEYRETMRASLGPVGGRLVREDGFYSILFLETGKILFARSDSFAWNQIHLRGFYPDPGPIHPLMTRYMEEADPQRGGFAKVFKRLDAIRSKPRDDVAREVMSLEVGAP